ncbi:low-affinity phosphate transporter PitH [Isoptericola halotolerans]|uniref:PiT family inorganic phosphate transporter n=1 Tax=Isoptericola halotolerans TaxID=300560 RepID=A0ABX1ZZP9_9MICO|nr:PiT family inorganic phosphate transporter [Isoptericola halotolerans]
MELALVVLVVAVALGFAYTNGFLDAANSVATSISTRALTPRIAVAMAAAMNFIGALLGTAVAETIATSIVDLDGVTPVDSLVVVLSALLGAIVWNLVAWWFGMPTSSTHSLVGGLLGAGIAGGMTVHADEILDRVVLPLLISPVAGFVAAFALMVALLWIFRNAAPSRVNRRFRIAQTASAAAVALGHGLQSAQKTMGVVWLALMTIGAVSPVAGIPLWVKLAAATALAAGTYAGGWRIMRTLGRRIIEIDPARGFVAESVSAMVLYVSSIVLHAPVSTTHTITAAIVGVGSTRRLSAVRWGVARTIAAFWLLTAPTAALLAAGATWALLPLVG